MCNCGKNRAAYSRSSQPANTARKSLSNNFSDSTYEYAGRTALTVVGNVTGKRYRFSYPGDKQNIDHRDVKAMEAVPGLRKMR